MIIVHHLNHSRSQRVLWMLEELGAPYEIVRYDRDPKTMLAPPALKTVHPLGKSPVIEDDGVVFAETGAIVQHLAERYEALMPSEPAARRQAIYWLHFAEGSASPPLLMKLFAGRIGEAGAPLVAHAEKQVAGWLALVQTALESAPYLAGDALSVADIMMSYPIQAALARGAAGRYAGVEAYMARLEARPAYVRALEQGGPFAILK